MTENKSAGFSNVIVLGAGAIGSYYGSLLSREADVLLVGRKRHVDAVNAGGLEVSGAVREVLYVKASTELKAVPRDSLLLVTTKAYDLAEAIKGVRRLLTPDTTVLVLQNGLGNEVIAGDLIDRSVAVVRGLASSGVEFLRPGKIEVKFAGETVLPRTPAGVRIKRLFDSCGLETRLTDRMDYEIWRKLALNCVINPLTALFRVPNKEIAADSLEGVRRRVVAECVRVAREEGVALDPALADEVTEAAASYSNLSSMCQDAIRGRRTEIDFLNGRIAELGRQHGIPTPVNDVLSALIRFMEGKE